MYAVGRPRINYVPSDSAAKPGRRTSSWATGCGSRAMIGSGPAARSPSTEAILRLDPTRCASTRRGQRRRAHRRGAGSAWARPRTASGSPDADRSQAGQPRLDFLLPRARRHAIGRISISWPTRSRSTSRRRSSSARSPGATRHTFATSSAYAMRAESLASTVRDSSFARYGDSARHGWAARWTPQQGPRLDARRYDRRPIRLRRFGRKAARGAEPDRSEEAGAVLSSRPQHQVAATVRRSIIPGATSSSSPCGRRAGGVDRVDVRGKVDGVQLEAASDSLARRRRQHEEARLQGATAMSTPDWIATLGDRDPRSRSRWPRSPAARVPSPRCRSAAW